MPEDRFFSRLVYMVLAAVLLAPALGSIAQEQLPHDVDDFPLNRPMEDITERGPEFSAASVLGAVTILLQGKEDNVRAKRETTFKVTAVDGEGILIRDAKLVMDFGDGKTQKMNFDRRAVVKHTWKSPGSYQMNFDLVDGDTTLARGRARVRVDKSLKYYFEVIADDSAALDEASKYRFMVFAREARAAKGTLTIDWGDGTTDTVEDFAREVTRSHTYTAEGTFKVKATFTTVFGQTKSSRTLRVEVTEAGGTVDLSRAIIAGNAARDISTYRVTSTMTKVTITRNLICVFHTKAGAWPVRDGVEGNPWIVAFVDGKLHAGTWEWLRPGQVCKGIEAAKSGGTHRAIGPHVGNGPLTSWVPKVGEIVWFFVSTHARLSLRSSNERAEPVEVRWPQY
ncbi:MAG: hypothetical protein GKS06_11335 [Acidobacteria bacterium]|nr:hypothetical protein [Acidobacteriota bacterium]